MGNELLERQLQEDYFQKGMTLPQMYKKYRRLDHRQIIDMLHLYDPKDEPKARDRNYGTLPGEWDAICRKLNPKAWEGR